MPAVRVERLPVQAMGLGLLGFDHLQIIYRSDLPAPGSSQDGWFVIEGLREPDGSGVRLGVEGWHGGTTLSDANGGATGEALARRIGTPESRVAREIAEGPKAVELWATLVSYAADIEAQRFPYIAMALPGSPLPILNSSSLVASLLHHAGVAVEAALPPSLRFSPGVTTLLGTSGDDTLIAGHGFTTLLAGDGHDRLSGSDEPGRIDKLYGGRGDDVFHWSRGLNVIHGGQPGLAYADDGLDSVDYSGAGDVRLEAPPAAAPHLGPDFVATYPGGQDHLFSIEEIAWDGRSDRLVIGKGVGLASAPLGIDLGGEAAAGRGDVVDLSQADVGFEVTAAGAGALRMTGRGALPGADTPGLAVRGAEWIVGSPHGDRMALGPGLRGVEGGPGDDVFEVRSAGPLAVSGGAGADRYVIAHPSARLAIDDAAPEDRIVVAWSPSGLAVAYDPDRSQDLVIRLFAGSAEGDSAEIRVRGYRTGDLGLDIGREIVLVEDGDGLMLASGAPETPVSALSPADPMLDLLLAADDLTGFAWPDAVVPAIDWLAVLGHG